MTKLFASFLLVLSSPVLAQITPTLSPESQVTYTARDDTSEWSGTAPVETLQFTLNPDDVAASELSVTLRPANFDSGNLVRDANARRGVFEAGEFPEIRFDLSEISGADASLAEGETQTLSLSGDLTMHGVTQTLELESQVSRTTNTLTATGNFTVLLSDFNMTRPEFFGNQVADEVDLAFEIIAELP